MLFDDRFRIMNKFSNFLKFRNIQSLSVGCKVLYKNGKKRLNIRILCKLFVNICIYV